MVMGNSSSVNPTRIRVSSLFSDVPFLASAHSLTCPCQFVVSMAGAAYDAQVEGLNRKKKVRQEVFIESSRFADFGVGAGVCFGNSVSGKG